MVPALSTSLLFSSLAISTLATTKAGTHAPHQKRDEGLLELPVIEPEFYDTYLAPAMDDEEVFPPPPKWGFFVWNNDSIPLDCYKMIHEDGTDENGDKITDLTDVEVFTVTYSDCELPWTMCWHPSTNGTKTQMAENFGKLPVVLRSYMRLAAAAGGSGAYAVNNNVFMKGGTVQRVSVWGHEVGHNLDGSVLGNETWFSDSEVWLQAYDEDYAVVQDYARTSQAENFAQMVNVALYDLNIEGGIGNFVEDWDPFASQLMAIEENHDLWDALTMGGSCNPDQRFMDMELISKDGHDYPERKRALDDDTSRHSRRFDDPANFKLGKKFRG